MELRLAKNAGFCSGVRNAVTLAESAASAAGITGRNVWTLGELIHNPQELARLCGMGIKIANAVEDVPQGDTLIIRSHGVEPYVFGQCGARGINVIDATCRYVKRMHGIAAEASRKQPIVIVGSAKHPEVTGTAGWCAGEVFIVADADEAAKLSAMDEAAVIAQTTIAPELFDKVVEALRIRVTNLTVFDTICNVTAKRQEEAVELAKWADAMIVVGGANSSNTKQLAQTCEKYCSCVYYLSGADEIKEADAGIIKDKAKVGVVSGASTPDWVLSEVAEEISERQLFRKD
ncbi:MAG: 4-hydroxy-3-methylbut-2-enyl diphosphate reductase [Oscillospiraceae bacterium]|nr:4-hydroxy-3-methylbut-2-enyl diphosphate reductase [Oscillospiraceae bacterium]